jgi:hypothetical protein
MPYPNSREVTYAPTSRVVRAVQGSPDFQTWLEDAVTSKKAEIRQAMTGVAVGAAKSFTWVFSNQADVTNGIFGVNKLTVWRAGSNAAQAFPPDLYAAVGDAQTIVTAVQVQVRRDSQNSNKFTVDSMEVLNGTIIDLFDWDYEVTVLKFNKSFIKFSGINLSWIPTFGAMASAGALLQASHLGINSTKPGGLVFRNIYQLKGSFLGFTLDTAP